MFLDSSSTKKKVQIRIEQMMTQIELRNFFDSVFVIAQGQIRLRQRKDHEEILWQ